MSYSIRQDTLWCACKCNCQSNCVSVGMHINVYELALVSVIHTLQNSSRVLPQEALLGCFPRISPRYRWVIMCQYECLYECECHYEGQSEYKCA